jgi:CubicO group peptidase (beta-lactamase class C family)
MKDTDNMTITLFAVLSLGTFLYPACAAAEPEPLRTVLESAIVDGMKVAHVPGVAVAMVKDGSVLFSGGFGVRKVGGAERVDENTLFAIGSVSKSFTAASVALLVDRKKLQWDDRVQQYLPAFQLADSTRASEITIRDLLSHRTGVQSDNLVFWGTGVGSKELIRRFPALKVPWGLRERFDYNNLMYMVAGEVIAQVTGEPWPEFVRKNIFLPLGMSSTSAQTSDLKDRVNIASAHMQISGGVRPIPLLDIDNIAPAGAIVSNVTDMTRWLRFQLGENVAGSARLLSAASLAEMHSAQIALDRNPPYSWLIQGSVLSAYGFGWMLSDYHGHLLLQHGGDTDGMASLIALVPDQHFGLVILSNLGDPWFRQVALYRVLDALLQRPAFDWAAFYRDIATQYAQQSGAPPQNVVPKKGSHPASLPLCQYSGNYRHPLYGDAVVSCDGGSLHIGMLGNRAGLTHLRYDTFTVEFEQFNALQQQAIRVVTFGLDAGGRATTFTIADEVHFTRVEQSGPARS